MYPVASPGTVGILKQSLVLETRGRWKIPNELRPEQPPEVLRAALDVIRKAAPDAILRSISATYNCVGMVVAARRVWVDPEDLARILTDDGYLRLPGADEADHGDVVIYHDDEGEPCHVGLVVKRNILTGDPHEDLLTVLSKWGAGGEYVHGASKVPAYLGKPAEFWTDRRGA
jgi:hypothetical protein